MVGAPVDDSMQIWTNFSQAARSIVEHPLATIADTRGVYFGDWAEAAVAAMESEEVFQHLELEMRRLEDRPAGRRTSELLLQELQAFTRYAQALVLEWDEIYDMMGGAGQFDIQMPRPDNTGLEESHSVLSTVLDSLCELFPQLKGIFKAGKEALDIRKAFILR